MSHQKRRPWPKDPTEVLAATLRHQQYWSGSLPANLTATASWKAFASSWGNLPLDRHLADGATYRRRRYSVLSLDPRLSTFAVQPHAPFFQPLEENPVNGGVLRHFDPIEPHVPMNLIFEYLVLFFGGVFSELRDVDFWTIDVHQHRVTGSAAQLATPVPEGRHRDGSDFGVMLLVNRTNATGGESRFYTDGGDLVCARTLTTPGDCLLINDRALLHDATPLTPASPDGVATRDMFFLLFRGNEPRTPPKTQ